MPLPIGQLPALGRDLDGGDLRNLGQGQGNRPVRQGQRHAGEAGVGGRQVHLGPVPGQLQGEEGGPGGEGAFQRLIRRAFQKGLHQRLRQLLGGLGPLVV